MKFTSHISVCRGQWSNGEPANPRIDHVGLVDMFGGNDSDLEDDPTWVGFDPLSAAHTFETGILADATDGHGWPVERSAVQPFVIYGRSFKSRPHLVPGTDHDPKLSQTSRPTHP